MKFISQPPPQDGDIRTRSAFLWFPKEIGLEMRWLERASWYERYIMPDLSPYPHRVLGWRAIGWAKL
jgi:hypothetical protein